MTIFLLRKLFVCVIDKTHINITSTGATLKYVYLYQANFLIEKHASIKVNARRFILTVGIDDSWLWLEQHGVLAHSHRPKHWNMVT